MSGIDQSYEIFEAFAMYLKTNSKKKTPQSQKTDIRTLNIALHYFEQILGLTLMSEVGLEHLEQFEQWAAEPQECGPIKKEPWSPASVLRHGKTLKSIFRKALHTRRIQYNPAAEWKLANVDPMKPRRPMTEAEFEILYDLSETWFKPILKALFLTGQRGSGIARMKWEHVNFEKGIVMFTSRKGGVGREKRFPFPLIVELREVIESMPRCCEYVFTKDGHPIQGTDISSAGHRLIKKSGLKDLVIYGARHGFITRMVASGQSTEVTRRLAGHSNENLIKQYSAHLDIDVLEKAVSSMSQRSKQSE
jgi:integrase